MMDWQRGFIASALSEVGGHVGKAAMLLRVERTRLYKLAAQCGLDLSAEWIKAARRTSEAIMRRAARGAECGLEIEEFRRCMRMPARRVAAGATAGAR